MNNYHFSDFTLDNYKKLLSLAKNNYQFSFFNESYKAKSVLLRHDLEFSIPIAVRMAEIEAELGIKSTYFIQLHSEFYNLLERRNFEGIKKIQELGHQLGLHFDSRFWNITDESQLDKAIKFDKDILEKYFDTELKAFSFHNNTDFTLSCRKESYGALLNVYSDYFRDNYGYTADSLGYWRFERMEDRLLEAKDEALQLLFHDGMWQHEVMPPRQRVFKVIDDHSAFLKKFYDDHLTAIGQKNVDWEGDINGND